MKAVPISASDQPADTALLGLDSAALARLMEEVRNNAVSSPTAYNRTDLTDAGRALAKALSA